jgi:hypothetical protein
LFYWADTSQVSFAHAHQVVLVRFAQSRTGRQIARTSAKFRERKVLATNKIKCLFINLLQEQSNLAL